jgi:hypothetical protein
MILTRRRACLLIFALFRGEIDRSIAMNGNEQQQQQQQR